MLFDSTLLFWHATSAYQFTAGEFVNLAGTTGSSTSTAINLGNARDLGIGEGAERPNVEIVIGTGITSSSSSLTVNFQFEGSTNGVLYTVYAETGAYPTSSLQAGAVITMPVPRRPPGIGLPLYYQLNALVQSSTSSISTGSVLAGIVLSPSEMGTLGQYPAGFVVA